ncbi:MAG TPA: GNAT family protein [Acidimicrobiales bacterium]|nr:GNAT family protein [Acidimicrobiales bacterium]
MRAMSLTDVDGAFEAVTESVDEVRRWLWWAQGPLDEDSYHDFVRAQSEKFVNDVEWRYYVIDRFDNHLVGGGSINPAHSTDTQSASVGYWIRTSCTKRQFATQAASLLTDAAFTYLTEIAEVEISMDVANVASARIPAKLGFSLRGEFDRAIRAPGHTGRGFIWSLSRAAWRGPQESGTSSSLKQPRTLSDS